MPALPENGGKMANLKLIQEQLEDLDRLFDEVVINIAKRYEDEIIEMNTDDQLFDQGITSKGRRVRPAYTALTKIIKREKGQPTDRVTLRDKGDFHESWEVVWGRDHFYMMATNWKARELRAKYSPDIYGLTDTNKEQLQRLIRPHLQAELLAIFRKS